MHFSIQCNKVENQEIHRHGIWFLNRQDKFEINFRFVIDGNLD